jgi:outer membrane murein-binding lipoprotein Lpp
MKRLTRMGWTGALLMMMVAGATVFGGTAVATSHSESSDCTGSGFRACVNAKLDLQAMQIHRLSHQVKGLKITVLAQADQIAALQAADTQQTADISKLTDTYNCQLGDLLNVTTTLVPNLDGNNVEALILNHHGLVPNWALVFNGCHSTTS